MIRFLLNNEVVVVDDIRADVTVLQWLREYKLKTGTKEGCGSGDCGACTVVVASLVESANESHLHYESLNSCICFVGSLHGKQLITVEDLAVGDELHPVQTAMVEEHGSQCGFCTPGFIMSMFALYHQDGVGELSQDDEKLQHWIDRSLSGNLCRCTGYAPIKRATIKALQNHKPDRFTLESSQTIEALRAIRKKAPMHPRFLHPLSISELASMRIQYPHARVLAGGTDLALEVTQQLNDIDNIIYLKQVPELLDVSISDEQISIGAAVSLNRCMKVLSAVVPSSEAMMLRFGSEQVRNHGTIGGNIANASPVGDLPPLLLALNAELVLQAGDNTRVLNINDFYFAYKQTALQKDEFIRTIHIPVPNEHTKVFISKISKRLDDDISAVCGVFCLDLTPVESVTTVNDAGEETRARSSKRPFVHAARIAFGGMAAVPARAYKLEQALQGHVFDEAAVINATRALADDFTPIDDARASAEYRETIAENLFLRCMIQFCQPDMLAELNDYVGG